MKNLQLDPQAELVLQHFPHDVCVVQSGIVISVKSLSSIYCLWKTLRFYTKWNHIQGTLRKRLNTHRAPLPNYKSTKANLKSSLPLRVRLSTENALPSLSRILIGNQYWEETWFIRFHFYYILCHEFRKICQIMESASCQQKVNVAPDTYSDSLGELRAQVEEDLTALLLLSHFRVLQRILLWNIK